MYVILQIVDYAVKQMIVYLFFFMPVIGKIKDAAYIPEKPGKAVNADLPVP
jgi:hypothetical protein